jgi:hypothetical protein
MPTDHEKFPFYPISISKGSNAPDDATLVGSGDFVVRWLDGTQQPRGRRYRDPEEISTCLVLNNREHIDAAIEGLTIDTYIPFELGHLPGEGESGFSVDVVPSTVTDDVFAVANFAESTSNPTNDQSGSTHDTERPDTSAPTKHSPNHTMTNARPVAKSGAFHSLT